MIANGLTGYGPLAGFSPPYTGNTLIYGNNGGIIPQALYGSRNNINELPGMRRFNMADRNRDKVRGMLNWEASEQALLPGRRDYNTDDYANSVYGLKSAQSYALNFEGTFAATEDLSASLFYTYEDIRSKSAGDAYGANSSTAAVNGVHRHRPVVCYGTILARNLNGKQDPCLNWNTDMRDKVDTLGLALRQTGLLGGRLRLGADLTYARQQTDVSVNGGSYVNNPLAIAGAPAGTVAAYLHRGAEPADRDGEDHHAAAERPSTRSTRSPRSARSTSTSACPWTDWAYDGTQFGSGTNYMPTNEQVPNYNVQRGRGVVHVPLPLTPARTTFDLPQSRQVFLRESNGPMPIALFADVHSNLEALDACLAHARSRGADEFAFLGDLVGYGADPAAVIDIVAEHSSRGAVVVKGNHDAAIAGGKEYLNDAARTAIAWSREALSPRHRAFLEALPLCVRKGPVCFVHASAASPERWDYIDSPGAAERSAQAAATPYTFCGHVHDQMLYAQGSAQRMVAFRPQPAVAIPVGAHRAWLARSWARRASPATAIPRRAYARRISSATTVTFHRVPYDHLAAARKIRAAGLPEIPRLSSRAGHPAAEIDIAAARVIDGFTVGPCVHDGAMGRLFEVTGREAAFALLMKVPAHGRGGLRRSCCSPSRPKR